MATALRQRGSTTPSTTPAQAGRDGSSTKTHSGLAPAALALAGLATAALAVGSGLAGRGVPLFGGNTRASQGLAAVMAGSWEKVCEGCQAVERGGKEMSGCAWRARGRLASSSPRPEPGQRHGQAHQHRVKPESLCVSWAVPIGRFVARWRPALGVGKNRAARAPPAMLNPTPALSPLLPHLRGAPRNAPANSARRQGRERAGQPVQGPAV